jgi:hypothetical protein
MQDPQWTAAHFVNDQPYRTTDLFNSFFAMEPSLSGKSMLSLVSNGGGGSPATKAARDIVAAYLNASRFGDPGQGAGTFPYSRVEIATMWSNAVNHVGGVTFASIHNALAGVNQGNCPTP